MDTPRFLSGQLLLAMPGMGDPMEERWTNSFRAAGIDPRLLTAQAGAA